MKRAILTLLVAASIQTAPAAAQTEASVGLGVGTVRYPGGTTFGTAIVWPALRYATTTFVADLAGSVASLPGSVWSSQARASVWGMTSDLASGLRLGGEATFAGTTLSPGGSTAAAHGVVELLSLPSPAWGVGIGAGPSTGMISGAPPVTALHIRARAWARPGGGPNAPDLQLTIEPTRFPDGWFADASAGATLERGRTVVSVAIAGRVAAAHESKAAGSVFLQWFAMPRVSVELGGGSYLNDPYQGLPRAGFITFGVRLHRSPRAPRVAAAPAWGPLVPDRRGDSLIVRFRMEGARSVGIAGDWNAWQPAGLRPLGDDVWEGTLALGRGVYHFNLLVDGADWVVPNGVATVPDGLGGMVAVLIVP